MIACDDQISVGRSLATIYPLHDREQVQVELVLWYLERELTLYRYSRVDYLLMVADVRLLAPASIVSVLSITWHGRHFLPNRDNFIARAEPVLVALLGEQRTLDLLETRR